VGGGGDAPAFESGQFAQLDPLEPMVPERAQKRVLPEARTELLRLERADTPPEARAGVSPIRATATIPPRVPRHKQRTE